MITIGRGNHMSTQKSKSAMADDSHRNAFNEMRIKYSNDTPIFNKKSIKRTIGINEL